MNEQQQDTLDNLRKAAEKDQWNLCREALAILIPDLEQADTIRIIANHARRFLSDLSRSHPEDENIGRAIDALDDATGLEALDRQGRLIDPILDNYWDWPGVSSFRNAFKGISKPQQYFEHSGEYADTVVSLFSHMISAIEMNLYWGGDPEFSKIAFGSDSRAAVFMLARHYSDPRQIALRVSLWTELAGELEMALQAH